MGSPVSRPQGLAPSRVLGVRAFSLSLSGHGEPTSQAGLGAPRRAHLACDCRAGPKSTAFPPCPGRAHEARSSKQQGLIGYMERGPVGLRLPRVLGAA